MIRSHCTSWWPDKQQQFLSTFIKELKKVFVTVQQKNAYKLEFADNLWLLFLDQLLSDIVVFEINNFQIYSILVTKWKHVTGPNDIITFNGCFVIYFKTSYRTC